LGAIERSAYTESRHVVRNAQHDGAPINRFKDTRETFPLSLDRLAGKIALFLVHSAQYSAITSEEHLCAFLPNPQAAFLTMRFPRIML
jgi:hypothetical protein